MLFDLIRISLVVFKMLTVIQEKIRRISFLHHGCCMIYDYLIVINLQFLILHNSNKYHIHFVK